MWHSLAVYAHLSEQVRNALKFCGSWKIDGKGGENSRASALCNFFCGFKARWGKFAAIVVGEKEEREREKGRESESASGACNIKF